MLSSFVRSFYGSSIKNLIALHADESEEWSKVTTETCTATASHISALSSYTAGKIAFCMKHIFHSILFTSYKFFFTESH